MSRITNRRLGFTNRQDGEGNELPNIAPISAVTKPPRKGRTVYRRSRTLALLVFLAISCGRTAIAGSGEIPLLPPPAKRKIDFRRDVEPILREHCQSCHGPEKQMAGLRLDNRADALKGGNSGTVIRPGNSADSKLIHLVAGLRKNLVMPFDSERLTAEQVGVLRAWIDQGAGWPLAPIHPANRPKGEN